MTPPKPSPAETLIARGRAAWAAQDGATLATLPLPDTASGMERGVLALLASAGRLQAGNVEAASRIGRQGLREGLDPRLLGLAWLASVEDDLCEAGSGDAATRRERAARWRAAVLERADPEAAREPPTRLGTARDDAQRLRDEVTRQRALIGKLRGELNTRPADPRTPDRALIARILDARLTYLSTSKMQSIARTCRALEEQHVPGTFLEAGCALGGSAILIAAVKATARPLEVYDVFGMIPPPSEQDTPDVHERYRTIVEGRSTGIGGDRYYGYQTDLLRIVARNFVDFGLAPADHGVAFVQGLVQDTLVGTGPVALAHLDLDWYEPVTVCLERLWPRLSPGGSIIVDDYHDWGGCRRAVDRFLGLLQTGYVADDAAGSLKLTKVAT